MEFEWDAEKAESNLRKHGISFELARRVFFDPDFLEWPDTRGDYEEERWSGVGLLFEKEITVAYTRPRRDLIRLISARKAERHERSDYWNR